MRYWDIRRGVLFGLSFIVALVVLPSVFAANDGATLTARLARLERSLESRGLVDLVQQVDNLQQEVQRLVGQLEEQSYKMEQLRKTQRDTYVDIDQRLQGVEQRNQAFAGGPTDLSPEPPLTTLLPNLPDSVAGTPVPQSSLQVEASLADNNPVETVTDPSDAAQPSGSAVVAMPPSIAAAALPNEDNEATKAAYKAAFSLLKAGQYDDSITAFNSFLEKYPNSQYADNAQYWLGETFYVRREFEPAVEQYQKLIQSYPASKKRSHAMLKIGYSYHELGQIDQARAILEDIRNSYAGSTAARLAEDRIRRMLAETAGQ